MNAFKFSLQALLTLRERQEQVALQAYGEELNAQERAVSRLESTRQEFEEAQAHFQTRLRKGCAAQELDRLHAWKESIEQRLLECDHRAKVARNRARLAFSKLLAARHATAVLLKLQEGQKRRHQRTQRRQEQKVMDDLASRRGALALLLQIHKQTLWN